MNNESVKLNKEENNYVLIDIGDVSSHNDIRVDAPYTISGLDSKNPILTITEKINLVGEYMETIGTSIVFFENKGENQNGEKIVEPVAKTHKILKFKLALDNDNGETNKPTL